MRCEGAARGTGRGTAHNTAPCRNGERCPPHNASGSTAGHRGGYRLTALDYIAVGDGGQWCPAAVRARPPKPPTGRAEGAARRGRSGDKSKTMFGLEAKHCFAAAHTLEGLGTPAGTGPGAQPGEERGPERRAHPRERAAGPPDEPGIAEASGLLKGWLWRVGRWWQCRRLCPAHRDRGARVGIQPTFTGGVRLGGSLALAASLPHWYTKPTGPGIGRPGGR